MDPVVGEALRAIREELDEHLETLNQNTSEISAAHEYVSELDAKLEKLAERVDALQALLLAQSPQAKPIRLTPREEEVFGVLLRADDALTSAAIGRVVGLTGDLAAQTLFCLRQKGVPVLAQEIAEDTFYALEAQQKDAYRDHVAMRPVAWKKGE